MDTITDEQKAALDRMKYPTYANIYLILSGKEQHEYNASVRDEQWTKEGHPYKLSDILKFPARFKQDLKQMEDKLNEEVNDIIRENLLGLGIDIDMETESDNWVDTCRIGYQPYAQSIIFSKKFTEAYPELYMDFEDVKKISNQISKTVEYPVDKIVDEIYRFYRTKCDEEVEKNKKKRRALFNY